MKFKFGDKVTIKGGRKAVIDCDCGDSCWVMVKSKVAPCETLYLEKEFIKRGWKK
jgi:hypothetical protein